MKNRGKWRRSATGLICAGFAMLSVMPVHAKSANVTAAIKKDSQVTELIKQVNNYTSAIEFSYIASNRKNYPYKKTKSLKLDNRVKLNMTAIAIYHADTGKPWSAAKVKKAYTNLFGGKAALGKIPSSYAKWEQSVSAVDNNYSKSWLLYKKNGKYVYFGGQFGPFSKSFKITKALRVKKNRVDVTFKSYLKYFEDPKPEEQGVVTVQLEKSGKSKYGYIIKGIKIKRTHKQTV